MSETQDRRAVECPSCSPELETVHEVLSPGGGSVTVRCGECGHVHKVQPTSDPEVTLDVVVSQGGESTTANVTTPADETIAVGDEFLLETEEMLATVRQPFQQAEHAFERRFRGSGLGLTIADALVSLLGGELDLESELGKGTRVDIVLPASLRQEDYSPARAS